MVLHYDDLHNWNGKLPNKRWIQLMYNNLEDTKNLTTIPKVLILMVTNTELKASMQIFQQRKSRLTWSAHGEVPSPSKFLTYPSKELSSILHVYHKYVQDNCSLVSFIWYLFIWQSLIYDATNVNEFYINLMHLFGIDLYIRFLVAMTFVK